MTNIFDKILFLFLHTFCNNIFFQVIIALIKIIINGKFLAVKIFFFKSNLIHNKNETRKMKRHKARYFCIIFYCAYENKKYKFKLILKTNLQ